MTSDFANDQVSSFWRNPKKLIWLLGRSLLICASSSPLKIKSIPSKLKHFDTRFDGFSAYIPQLIAHSQGLKGTPAGLFLSVSIHFQLKDFGVLLRQVYHCTGVLNHRFCRSSAGRSSLASCRFRCAKNLISTVQGNLWNFTPVNLMM